MSTDADRCLLHLCVTVFLWFCGVWFCGCVRVSVLAHAAHHNQQILESPETIDRDISAIKDTVAAEVRCCFPHG